ncbi:aldose 1-epimerase [Parapedobacter composti]|uniref:Aldose 1-epimerase n=1 Tax=Parapedobacter composti TaxID=623281 RepID=A0A1I1DY38_9SPHI|nr:aldose epimerase family protein [Parapedobacter composti]SFB79346.1 aldose 1-epimerase [Parapedobacter composti]
MKNKISKSLTFVLAVTCAAACNPSEQSSRGNDAIAVLTVSPADFEAEINGDSVKLYTLTNGTAVAAITNYGARVVSLHVPDKAGELVDVVLGYNDLASYRKPGEGFYGAVVGRFGNRIANGQFELNGQQYQLELNDGPNTLHGGTNGFFAKVWEVKHVTDSSLELQYISPDGDAGYPGKLEATVVYTLTADHALDITYRAATDKATVVNLTNHAYFNLSGEGDSTILDHLLTIRADGYTPVDETLIPTGEITPVDNTPFDFRQPTAIGARIDTVDAQLVLGKGYDHNFVLKKEEGLQLVATVESPKTGIVMDILTEEPGLQFYSGNFMDNVQNAKGGKTYGYRSAFCLETQHFPDSPNKPDFPSTVLEPGAEYRTRTVYRFR